MMHDSEQSESPIVAMKSPNKAEGTVAEAMERRGDAKRNALQATTRQTPSWESVSPGLERVRESARTNPKLRFTSLLHHITPDLLRVAYLSLKRKAAPGIDGVTWDAYGEDLESKLNELHGRIHRGAYRALPSRRRMIPKPDGRERPLGIASLEDYRHSLEVRARCVNCARRDLCGGRAAMRVPTAFHRTSRLPFVRRKRLSHYDDYTTAKQRNQAFFNTVHPFRDAL
jgi:hypothetical protein